MGAGRRRQHLRGGRHALAAGPLGAQPFDDLRLEGREVSDAKELGVEQTGVRRVANLVLVGEALAPLHDGQARLLGALKLQLRQRCRKALALAAGGGREQLHEQSAARDVCGQCGIELEGRKADIVAIREHDDAFGFQRQPDGYALQFEIVGGIGQENGSQRCHSGSC